MKHFITATAFCLISFILNAQSTFEFLRSNQQNEIAACIIEDNTNNIYFSVENSINALIIKLDPNGTISDSVQIINPSGSCDLSELIRVNDDQLVALGNWTSDSTSQLWFTKFNNNLDILIDKKLFSYGLQMHDFRHLNNHNDNIVFIATYLDSINGFNVCIYEITQEGNIIRKRFFDFMGFNIGYSILEDVKDYTYKLFARFPLDERILCFPNTLDSNFNIINIQYLIDIDGHNSAKWITDSTYLLTGKKYSSDEEEWDIGILKLNRADSVLSSTYIGKPDTVDWPGYYKNLDYISSNNIFYCGTTNSYSYPFQYEPSWIMVNVLDSALNLTSQQFFGGDAFYLVNFVLATHDSGCVISCSRFDYQIQNNENDVYLLKVNQDGLLVSIPEDPVISRSVCELYPNPGKDILFIESKLNNLHIELFDLNGKLRLNLPLESGRNILHTSHIPGGIYFYRVLDKKKHQVQTGKWLKY